MTTSKKTFRPVAYTKSAIIFNALSNFLTEIVSFHKKSSCFLLTIEYEYEFCRFEY